jgi:hypothetical protein
MLFERALARVVRVDGVSTDDLLDTDGEEIEQLRELELATGDEDAPQRNALFSFSKKPSSAVYVRSSACESNSSSRRRCSAFR